MLCSRLGRARRLPVQAAVPLGPRMNGNTVRSLSAATATTPSSHRQPRPRPLRRQRRRLGHPRPAALRDHPGTAPTAVDELDSVGPTHPGELRRRHRRVRSRAHHDRLRRRLPGRRHPPSRVGHRADGSVIRAGRRSGRVAHRRYQAYLAYRGLSRAPDSGTRTCGGGLGRTPSVPAPPPPRRPPGPPPPRDGSPESPADLHRHTRFRGQPVRIGCATRLPLTGRLRAAARSTSDSNASFGDRVVQVSHAHPRARGRAAPADRVEQSLEDSDTHGVGSATAHRVS